VKYLAVDTTKYDYILVDAVCSAEGRIHTENPKSYGFWSLANISEKAEKQYILLQSAIHHLAPGGTLVYSTCTLAPEENEAVVSRILAEYTDIHLAPISVPADIQYIPGLHEYAGATYHHSIGHTVRIIPTDTTEGFYIAKIQKK
jgi:16S rRNA (cytosine1407-C5)-methyltransferase